MSVNKIVDEKVMLRLHYKKMRDKMTPLYKKTLDYDIESRLICSREYMDAKLILCYVAKDDEVQTRGIIRAALANGKKVAVPLCESEGKMNFYLIDSLDDLRKGTFGIFEPDPSKSALLKDFDDSLCVVPGLSFDPCGNRLGFGRGYYDRFLETYKGLTVGLCYNSFIKWDIPTEKHDVPVKVLVTEGYLRRTSK